MKGGFERRRSSAVLHEVRWEPLPRAICVFSPRRYPSGADAESVADALDFLLPSDGGLLQLWPFLPKFCS